mgnify:CR=1 FL=1
MLDRDPPDHTRLRGLVNKAFTPRVVERLRPHIQDIVDDLLARVEARGSMDLIEEFAYPLPVIVICEMLGVPIDDHEPASHDTQPVVPVGGTERAELDDLLKQLLDRIGEVVATQDRLWATSLALLKLPPET